MKYKMHPRNLTTILSLLLCMGGATGFGQSGGTFEIKQSAIAGGGNSSDGGAFTLDSTSGQPVAGGAIIGPSFSVTSGFWNFTPMAPTASHVSIGGRIRTPNGQGIQRVMLTLIGLDGSTRTTISSSFGYYRFDEVLVGETYILNILSQRFTFNHPTIVVTAMDTITDLDFVSGTF